MTRKILKTRLWSIKAAHFCLAFFADWRTKGPTPSRHSKVISDVSQPQLSSKSHAFTSQLPLTATLSVLAVEIAVSTKQPLHLPAHTLSNSAITPSIFAVYPSCTLVWILPLVVGPGLLISLLKEYAPTQMASVQPSEQLVAI